MNDAAGGMTDAVPTQLGRGGIGLGHACLDERAGSYLSEPRHQVMRTASYAPDQARRTVPDGVNEAMPGELRRNTNYGEERR